MKTQVLSFILIISCSLSLFSQPESDLKKFLNGEALVYRSYNHSKSKGLDFSIKYLDNWNKLEGNRPNIVQKFTKDIGNKYISYSVLVLEIEGPKLTKNEIQLEFENVHNFLPKGAQLISKNSSLILDGEQACSIEFKNNRKPQTTIIKSGVTVFTTVYSVIYNNKLIQINCAVGGPSTESSILETHRAYQQFFAMITNSLIIQSKWKNLSNEKVVKSQDKSAYAQSKMFFDIEIPQNFSISFIEDENNTDDYADYKISYNGSLDYITATSFILGRVVCDDAKECFEQQLLAWKKSVNITYKFQKNNWFVMSGVVKDSGDIVYLKGYYGKNYFSRLKFAYPQSMKRELDNYVIEISKSFIGN